MLILVKIAEFLLECIWWVVTIYCVAFLVGYGLTAGVDAWIKVNMRREIKKHGHSEKH